MNNERPTGEVGLPDRPTDRAGYVRLAGTIPNSHAERRLARRFSSAQISRSPQISLTRLKLPKMAVFVTNSPQRAFSRNWPRQPTCRPKPKASFAREYWLRNVAALACCFAPQGHFFGLVTGTYGHHSVRAGALDAQIGAQNPQLVGSQAFRPL